MEILELKGSAAAQWRVIADYPFAQDGTYPFTWAKAGELNVARRAHGAIFTGEKMIIAGGQNDSGRSRQYILKSESCEVVNGLVTCIEQAPTLDNYYLYPEMYLVPDTFCKDI